MKTFQDFKMDEKSKKLDNLDSMDDKLKMIWMWIKQGQLNLKEFKQLLAHINN